ncbi:MAG: hypothetical protein ABIJ97_04735 [Bacteroidota bacterium]
MRALIMLVLISLFSFSCSNQPKSIDMNNAKTKIILNGVKNEHPNKEMMEWFLNNYEEEFIEQKEDIDTLENQNLIQNKFCFKTKLSGVSLFLIFCNNGKDALTVGNTNFSSDENNQNFGTNGAVLFVVKGSDKYKVNSVLNFFAGEE